MNPPKAAEPTRRVEVTVAASVPEYHQVKVRDRDGRMYALTRHTAGIDLATLRVGQRLVCEVTVRLARVLRAAAAGSDRAVPLPGDSP